MTQFDFGQGVEDQIVLLLITDEDFAGKFFNLIDVKHFNSTYAGTFARLAINFFQRFNNVPGSNFVEYMGKQFEDDELALEYLGNILKIEPNKSYIETILENFIRHRAIMRGVEEAGLLVDEGKFDDVESVLRETLTESVIVDPGDITSIKEPGKIIEIVYKKIRESGISTGIDAFDKMGFKFYRGEFVVLLGASNKGKSWGQMYFNTSFVIQGLKVLDITLEDDEALRWERYAMSVGCLSLDGKRLDTISVNNKERRIHPKKLTVENIKVALKTLKSYGGLYVWWPFKTKSTFTPDDLEAKLRWFESRGILFDAVSIDYDDYVTLDRYFDNPTTQSQEVYPRLIGIGKQRNLLMIINSQGTRASYNKAILYGDDISTDIQRVAKAGTVITVNQTEKEYKKGHSRLFITKRKRGRKFQHVIMEQCLDAGQFCLTNRKYSKKEEDRDD